MSRTHEPSRINQNQLGGGKSNRRQVKRAATSQRMWGTRPTRGWNPREVERMLLRWVERSGEKQSSAPRWSGRMNSSLSSRLRALLCSCARGHRFSLFSSGFVRLNPGTRGVDRTVECGWDASSDGRAGASLEKRGKNDFLFVRIPQ